MASFLHFYLSIIHFFHFLVFPLNYNYSAIKKRFVSVTLNLSLKLRHQSKGRLGQKYAAFAGCQMVNNKYRFLKKCKMVFNNIIIQH